MTDDFDTQQADSRKSRILAESPVPEADPGLLQSARSRVVVRMQSTEVEAERTATSGAGAVPLLLLMPALGNAVIESSDSFFALRLFALRW